MWIAIGQNEIAFAFCRLLGFDLLPRLKPIHRQKLYRPDTGCPEAYPHLQQILTCPIDTNILTQQYDEMIKFTTAMAEGTAEPEAILRRFNRTNVQHPTYRALAENDFLFYGKGSEMATNRQEDMEVAMLCLHLLQICMVYVNTLLIQEVLLEPDWQGVMTADDLRALTPLVYSYVNPYGLFPLDMGTRLPITNG